MIILNQQNLIGKVWKIMKQDLLLSHLIEIKEDVAMIKQHLADINGKVNKHETELNTIKGKIAYISGAISAGITGTIITIQKVFGIGN